MRQIKYFILTLVTLFTIGCNSNQPNEKRSATEEELVEATLYHHDFKVSAMIEELKSNDQIDKLIISERVASVTNKWTPLCFASFIGNRKAVIELIENGANLNFKDANGQSPIILASIAGNVEEIRILLKHGANINDMDINGSTPLIHAASQGNIETVKILVESGCIIKPNKGQSALDFAVFYQQDEVIVYLKGIMEK